MDAEDQPADTDKMKEQVVVSPVLSPSFLLFVSASMNIRKKKIVVTTFIFSISCQPLSATNESSVSPNSSQGALTVGHTREAAVQSGSFGPVGDHSVYSSNIFAPQAQAFYYRG